MAHDEVDALYGLPLERFVPERDSLAKRLRADGRRDDAAAVAKLGKPSVAAWVVNQLVRTQGATVRELWAAGDALLTAQAALLAGSGGADGLREASRAEQLALTPLLRAARGLLDTRGRGPTAATLEKVGETLHAAALEPALRAQVAAGRLDREQTQSGLGALTTAAAPQAPAEQERAPDEPPAQTGRDRLVAAMRASIAREREETAARAAAPPEQEPASEEDDVAAQAQARERDEAEARERDETEARERAEAEAREREETEARERAESEARQATETSPPVDAAPGDDDALRTAERELGAAVRAREAAADALDRIIAELAAAREELRRARRRERAAAQAVARLEDDAEPA